MKCIHNSNSLYNKNIREPFLTFKYFIELASIDILSWSRWNETLKSGAVDIRLESEFFQDVPVNMYMIV